MSKVTYSDEEAARALVGVLGDTRWEAVAFAHGYLASLSGAPDELAARIAYERGMSTLRHSRQLIAESKTKGFKALLPVRAKTGSAENPVTKLFPAAITEERFLEILDELCEGRKGLRYSDERQLRHSLVDFVLSEGELELPINIKNAGTRFQRAWELVGLAPDDCIPIPAYKANAAVETVPNLLYLVSVDYELVAKLNGLLPTILDRQELIAWDLLTTCGGSAVTMAEDAFVFSTVRKHWARLKDIAGHSPFHAISARKAVRILHTRPERTPGIGLRAWGTAASAEINIHVSIKHDTTPWSKLSERILTHGIENIIEAVNRKKLEEVHDPEI